MMRAMPASSGGRLASLLALDLRSLALMRIGLGIVVLVDLAVRAGDLRAHYTDFGILPGAELGGYPWRTVWNLHGLVSAWPEAVAALFVLQALAAVALVLGWHTWTATAVVWVLLSSLQYRNPPLAFGGDVMLRLALFFALLLPLGARLSLDARREPGRFPACDAYPSVAGVALMLQLAFVYWFSVLNRTGPTWWDGTALFYALHFDTFASGTAAWLRQHEALLPPMTLGAIWFEALGPFLLFSPLWHGPVRTLAVLLFVGFHVVLGVLFQIGLFPAVFSIVWIGMLPTWFWQRIASSRPAVAPQQPTPTVATAPARGPWAPSPWRAGLAAFALAWVLAVNLSTVRWHDPTGWLPWWWDLPAQALNLDQRWILFSPDPPLYDGWYVVKGVLLDGREVNLLEPASALSFEKPAVVSDTANIRWREFFFRLQRNREDPRWGSYGRWLCRAWNETHAGSERLDRAYVYFREETTTSGGPVRGSLLTLMAHDCAG